MEKEELSNVEIVLFALYVLGGSTKKVFTEDIAVKCFEIAPARFSWRLYPKYPDLETVRIALFDARKDKKGGLVHGRFGKATGDKISDGWIFSPAGISWIENNKKRVGEFLGHHQPKGARTEIDRWIKELEKTGAFQKFLKTGTCDDIKNYEFTDLLNASLDTPAVILRDRLQKIQTIAATAKHQKLRGFLETCRQRFSKILGV